MRGRLFVSSDLRQLRKLDQNRSSLLLTHFGALVFAVFKDEGFLNLKCGFDSRRGQGDNSLISSILRKIIEPHWTSQSIKFDH
jgi:hypothetical protein